ncbi:MAG: hypothetical protein IGR76_13600 [Synechococcales cyanobacterium T60_A2020_003]|nr:hypothetical protein [Synechococcales cyanobacterium T60_A2020_003]
MVERNLHNISQGGLPQCIVTGSAEALSHLKGLTDKELNALERWCANLPIDSDVRNRLSNAIDQVSSLRIKG